MPKPRAYKPGAQGMSMRPDHIEHYTVEQDSKLLDFLIAAMPDRKRTTVKDYLKHNQVMVGSTVTRQFDTELHRGDHVSVNTSREFQTFSHPRLKIVYEDDDIIVVNKGYGLLSVGTDNPKHNKETAYSLLRDYVKRVNPRVKLFVVHRLDQHTSGLMMFAKNIKAKEAMQHNWNNMVLERKYVAVVEGVPDPTKGQVHSFLAENSEHQVYSTSEPGKGKEALTLYDTLSASGGYALVELQLATGRKNQIRVHMKDLGHPIAGDRRYGARTSPMHRVALHARTLVFAHPTTLRRMAFSTAVPAPFAKTTGYSQR